MTSGNPFSQRLVHPSPIMRIHPYVEDDDILPGHRIICRVTPQGNSTAEQVVPPPISQTPRQSTAPSRTSSSLPSRTLPGTSSSTPTAALSNPVSPPSRPNANPPSQTAGSPREQPTASQSRSPGRIGPFRRLWHLDKT